MGVEENFHIGAYVLVKVKPEMKPSDKLFCENHPDWSFKYNSKFCRDCGSKLVPCSDREVYPHIYDILPEDEYLDKLVSAYQEGNPEDEIVLLGNMWFKDYPVAIDDEFWHREITPSMADLHVKNFKEKYADVIEVLRGRVESLEVRFGAVHWYS